MEFLSEYIFLSNLNPFQIILAALLGAIIGEVKDELIEKNDIPVKPSLFVSEILVATFISSLFGIIMYEYDILPEHSSIVLILTSLIGYVGYARAFSVFNIFLKLYLKTKNIEYDEKKLDDTVSALEKGKKEEPKQPNKTETTDSNDEQPKGVG